MVGGFSSARETLKIDFQRCEALILRLSRSDFHGLRDLASSIGDSKLTELSLTRGETNIGDAGFRELASSFEVLKLASLTLYAGAARLAMQAFLSSPPASRA